MHVLLEGYCSPFVGTYQVNTFLEQCPGAVGMTIIRGPFVEQYQWEGRDIIQGIVIIAESNITVKLMRLEAQQATWLDIFTCKAFELQPALNLAWDILNFKPVGLPIFLERGLDYLKVEDGSIS